MSSCSQACRMHCWMTICIHDPFCPLMHAQSWLQALVHQVIPSTAWHSVAHRRKGLLTCGQIIRAPVSRRRSRISGVNCHAGGASLQRILRAARACCSVKGSRYTQRTGRLFGPVSSLRLSKPVPACKHTYPLEACREDGVTAMTVQSHVQLTLCNTQGWL